MGRAPKQAQLALKLGLASLAIMPFMAATAHAGILTSSGNVNVSATVLPNLPTEGAFIDQPQDGEHFQTTPLVVIGRCQAGLLVRIFDNSQLAGSVVCAPDSTFTANITLVVGKNVLRGRNYDPFDQPGPDSPDVTVYVDKQPDATPEQEAEKEIAVAIGSPTSDTGATVDPTKTSERIFEGTVIEPIAKLLDLNATVASSTNGAVSVAVTASFAILLVTLLAFIIL